jgi:hypothetical protein
MHTPGLTPAKLVRLYCLKVIGASALWGELDELLTSDEVFPLLDALSDPTRDVLLDCFRECPARCSTACGAAVRPSANSSGGAWSGCARREGGRSAGG